MAKRKKRLGKGIESLNKVIEEHKRRKKEAQALGQEERVRYYEKEIAGLEKTRKNKERNQQRKN